MGLGFSFRMAGAWFEPRTLDPFWFSGLRQKIVRGWKPSGKTSNRRSTASYHQPSCGNGRPHSIPGQISDPSPFALFACKILLLIGLVRGNPFPRLVTPSIMAELSCKFGSYRCDMFPLKPCRSQLILARHAFSLPTCNR
jgi:hypothetical protein